MRSYPVKENPIGSTVSEILWYKQTNRHCSTLYYRMEIWRNIQEMIYWFLRYEGCVDSQGIGVEMERLAASMGGTIKWPYNDSECLDADFFKVVADHLVTTSGIR